MKVKKGVVGIITVLLVILMGSCGSAKNPLEGTWNVNDEEAKIVFTGSSLALLTSDGITHQLNYTFDKSNKAGMLYDGDGGMTFTLDSANLLFTSDWESFTATKAKTNRGPLEGIWDAQGEFKGVVLIFVDDSAYGLANDEAEEVTYTFDKSKKTGTMILDGDDVALTLKGNDLSLSADGMTITFSKRPSNAKANNIDAFLENYEKTITSWEKAVQSKKTADIVKISRDAANLYAKSESIINDTSKWTSTQLRRLTRLAERAAQAATASF
jgi:hypothetical protein